MPVPLSHKDIVSAAASLGLEPCVIRAVLEVESAGSGYLPSGRPKILFEGHIFWRELRKRDIDPAALNAPDILFPRWDRSKYKGGEKEWDRLEAAMRINEEAALCSASWGLFQIMGFNHGDCGFADVRSFVSANKESEGRQLSAFCAYIRSQGLLPALLSRSWAAFARRYNGPAYAENKYDAKLERAYKSCKAREGA